MTRLTMLLILDKSLLQVLDMTKRLHYHVDNVTKYAIKQLLKSVELSIKLEEKEKEDEN